MTDAKITSTVGVQMSGDGLTAAGNKIDQTLNKIVGDLNKLGPALEKAMGSGGKAADKVASQFQAQVKALGMALQQLQTIQGAVTKGGASGNLKAAGLFGDFLNVQQIGKTARAFAEFSRSSGEGVATLRGRVIQLNDEMGRMAKKGVLDTGTAFNVRRLEDTAKQYSKITNEVSSLRSRISLLGEDSRKAFQPMLNSLEELDKKNSETFGNKNRFDFREQLAASRQVVRDLSEQVGVREKIEAKTRLNIEALKEEGRQIIANNQAQRQTSLGAQVAAGTRDLGSIRSLGTGPLSQRDVDLTSRFSRATSLAAATRRELTVAMAAPNPEAERINTLITRYKALQKEIANTLVQQNQLKNPTAAGPSGFVGGFKSQIGKLYGGDGEGTGLAGLGALAARVSTYAVAASAIYGLISSLKEGIQFAVQFEDALAQLQAISGSTALELSRMSDAIFEVSKNSSTSVLELTQAATVLAQAGYGGNELGGLLDSVTKLADASGSTATEAVDILTSSLGSFQLEASESARVTDALVGVLNESKLGISQVQSGIQYLGATAKEQNISLNELVAMLGVMADAGIRGTTAATGLRQMFIDLLDPSKKLLAELDKVGLTTADIDVKVLGATEVLRRLRDHGFEAYGALETRAAAAYVAISSNVDAIGDLEQATVRSGAAAEAQATRVQSAAAQWQLMLNQFAKLASEIYTNLEPALKVVIGLINIIGTVALSVVKGITAIVGAIGRLGDAGTAAVNIQGLSDALKASGSSAEDTAAVLAVLETSMGDVETASNDLAANYDSLEKRQGSLQDETGKLILRQDELGKSQASVADQVNLLASRFPGLREEFEKTKGGIGGLIQAMFALDTQARRTMATVAAAQVAVANQRIDEANQKARDLKTTGGRTGFGYLQGAPGGNLAKFDAAVRGGHWRQALDISNSDPAVRSARDSQISQIVDFTQSYSDATRTRATAQTNQQMAEFLSSKSGAKLSQSVVRLSGASTLSASRGQGQSTVLSMLDRSLEGLDSFAKTPGLNQGTLAGLGQLRALLVSARPGLLPEEEKAKKGGGAGRSSANRERNNFLRSEADVQKEEAEYKKKVYDNAIKALEEAPTLDELPEIMDEVDNSLTDWLKAEGEVSLAEIERQKPTDAQRQRLIEAAANKANQLRLENIDKIADTLEKVIKEYITRATAAIERQYNESLRFTGRNVAIAQGRVQGLTNPLTSNNVPGYFSTVVQRQADVAQDRFNRASIPANDTRIAQYQSAIARVEKEKDFLNAELQRLGTVRDSGSLSGNEILVTGQKIAEAQDRLKSIADEVLNLKDKTYDLTVQNDALKASYDVLNDVPTTFRTGLAAAVQAVQIDVNAAGSFGQDIINNLDGPLKALHEGFQGFFSDILHGTKSVGQAFTDMADKIIDSILNMVAVALANQFFSLVAGFIGGAVGAPTNLLSGTPYAWNGGEVGSQIPIRNMWGGGSVSGGLPTRDSTLIHASKEEYLLRRPAAVSLGKDFLDDMNARGADAVRDLKRPIMPIMGGGKNETNVYVVKADQQPTLGRKDVLVVMHDDILQGGVTKQLIKRVSQGG